MSEIVDPLKTRSFGVKKPIEAKISPNDDFNSSKRTYPINKYGNKDEWGAMIHHQAEMHALQLNINQIEKRKKQDEYRAELK